MTAALGESVGITCGATDCLQIVVSQVSETPAYYDPDGYFDDEPEVPGNVFIQSYIDYLALDDGATYNPYDWALYVNGAQVSHHAFTIHGPQPELGSGELANGRTASGWLVYEVPPTGTVILSYAPNYNGPPVFEVTLLALSS